MLFVCMLRSVFCIMKGPDGIPGPVRPLPLGGSDMALLEKILPGVVVLLTLLLVILVVLLVMERPNPLVGRLEKQTIMGSGREVATRGNYRSSEQTLKTGEGPAE